jgi:hypothetical protein
MDEEQRDAAMQRWRRKAKPMPVQRAVLPYERTFSVEEWRKVVRGVVPRQMEDKWLVYMEDDAIFFHRSWTGACVFQVTVEQRGGEYAVRDVTVNRDDKQYNGQDAAYEASLLGFLIDALLLGKMVNFPVPVDLPKDTPPGLFQHHISGTGFPEAQ